MGRRNVRRRLLRSCWRSSVERAPRRRALTPTLKSGAASLKVPPSTSRESHVSNNIDGKIIVITGASSGLGRAAAHHLSSLGATIVLAARRAERIQTLAQELNKGGGRALAVTTDVSEFDQVQQLADTVVETYGRIDVLINNAGLMPLSPLDRLKVADWDRMIDVNIKGVLYGIGAVLPTMKKQESGHIINVASVAGHKVRPGSTVYSATKTAGRVISEGLRQEVKPYNIRTTVISPGAVDTELTDGVTEVDVAENIRKFYAELAVPADSFARAVAFAIGQPANIDINEILYRPTRQEY